MLKKIITKSEALRALAAFLIAPILPAFLYISSIYLVSLLFGGTHNQTTEDIRFILAFIIIATGVSWALILFFAIPLYFILKASNRLKPVYIIPIAGIISLLPTTYEELSRGLDSNSSYSSGSGRCDAIINNIRTLCGYIELIEGMIFIFLLGCLAGYIFCAIYFKKLKIWT